MKESLFPDTKRLTKLTEGDVGNVGEDAPPCRDEAGVFAPEEDDRDALAMMVFMFSSSTNKEFRPNDIPFVIFNYSMKLINKLLLNYMRCIKDSI